MGFMRGVLSTLLVITTAGCDGLFTGESVTRFGLNPVPGGGYAPLRVSLGPEMNPIALNFHATIQSSPADIGKWNTYRATLRRDGAVIASGEFNINAGTDPDRPSEHSASKTMLFLDVPTVADYDLAIDPVGSVKVTVSKPEMELRKNIQRPQK